MRVVGLTPDACGVFGMDVAMISEPSPSHPRLSESIDIRLSVVLLSDSPTAGADPVVRSSEGSDASFNG